jgi:membrane protein DedA with SNARE-associated domain
MNEWLLLQEGYQAYLILFLLLMGGAIGLPIPEDVPLIVGGYFAYKGSGKIQIILLVCYCSVLIGDLFIFLIGRLFGGKLAEKEWFKKRISEERLELVRAGLERRSLWMIFIARHLFYLRTATFLSCGALGMTITRFVIADAFAALISVPLMIGIGYFSAEHLDAVFHFVGRAKSWTLFVSLALLAIFMLYRILRKKKSPAQTQPD